MNFNVIPLIPSYQPDNKLIIYIDELIKNGFKKILVVNDGSSINCKKYFDIIKEKEECIVIEHSINKGKGQALKTGFTYYLENLMQDYLGIVTADSDGQHSIEDTINIAKLVEEYKDVKTCGVIEEDESYGNKLTKTIFKLLYNKTINDTQTGLRGFTNSYIKDCIDIPGNRYEYEMNMLIYATKSEITILEKKIDTIYIEENKSSHFNPIKDSIKIYKILFMNFFKFSFSGLLSFVIDLLLFVVFSNFLFTFLSQSKNIIISTIISRILSSMFNFWLNKNLVFKLENKNNIKITLLKYYMLCIVQMLSSGLLVLTLTILLPISKNIIKIIVDLFLFFISYKIQSNFIFKNNMRGAKK